ncbi:MAG: hypothetical protein BWZ10_00817 [candidate division BRC1 bacterium ADurb.BinA364]|nr:MAG: hypothetical protein BWZ10_00817 [candidate division BRC1 bacterium ADurb.BinA364]
MISGMRTSVFFLLAGLAFGFSGLSFAADSSATAASAEGSPYPPSPVIKSMTLDWKTHRLGAQGSDNFQLAWADDDHQYGSFGDGGGFEGTNSDGRVSLGVARVEGDWDSWRGYNVWGGKNAENPAQFPGKSWGMISLAGVLYMWWVPGYQDDPNRSLFEECRLARSVDHGATWTLADWAFLPIEGLSVPTFCVFGRDNAGARDEYVYHYFIHPSEGIKRLEHPVQKIGKIYLARSPQKGFFDSRDAFEFFGGLNDSGAPRWGALETKRPVFEDPAGVGWCVSVSHNPGLNRYLLCTEHDESHIGRMGVYDAPEPWGPWTTVYRWGDEYFGRRMIVENVFFMSFAPKWWSADGLEFTLVFTGGGRGKNNDSFNTIRGRFETGDRQ